MMEALNSDALVASKISFHLMSEQALTGIGFNQPLARSLVERITQEMTGIENEVEPQLPKRPLNKGELAEWRLPAKPYKKDGSLSSTMDRWLERTGSTYAPETRSVALQGHEYPVVGGEYTVTHGPMRMANQGDLKDWLVSKGWKPTLWNLQRDERGKPKRDDRGGLIKTTPKLQENGKLCPNLERLDGDLVRPVVKWLSLRNRRSVIEGWLGNERLGYDGRLSAGSVGFTSTFRQKHNTVVNVPKAQDGVTYGREMRSLFVADKPGYTLVGYDALALENRIEAHYCWKYPGGKEHAEDILNGDPHTKNAFVFYRDELLDLGWTCPEDVDKEDQKFKPLRTKAKSGRYLLSYGGSGRKLATTLGKPESQGEALYEAFWEANPALKALRERLTEFWETTGERSWVIGIDGRRVVTRSKHSVVNTLFQSAGAIAMDYSGLFMDRWLGGLTLDEDGRPCYLHHGMPVYRVGYFHDEYIWMVPDDLTDEIGMLGVKSIRKAGQFLKLNVELDGEYKAGPDWSHTH